MLLRQLIPAHFHASAVFRQLSEKTHYDMYSFIAADHLDYHRYEGGGAGGAGGGAGGGGGAGAEGSRSTTASTSLTQLGSAEGGGGCDAAAASFARTFWRDRIDCADDLEAAVRTLAAWQFDLVPEFVVQFCVAHNVHAHARLRILADTASDATVATVALDLLIHTPPPTPCSSSSISSSSSSDARPEEPEEPEEEPAAADKDLTEEEAWRAQLRAAPAVWPQTTLDFVNARRGGGGDDAALLVFLGDKLELAAAAGEKEWCRTLTLLVAGRRGLSRAAWARHSALVRHAQPALARLLLSRRDRSEEDDEVALCALTAALAAGASGNDADELWLAAAAAAPAGALRVLLDRGRPCGRAARAEVADALCRHAASDADLCAAALLHGAGPLWARAAAKHSRTHLFRACLLHAVDSWDTDDATDVAFAAVDAGADACVGLLCAALTTPPPELWMRRACRAARARTIAVLISNGGILSRDMADLALCNHLHDDDDAWRAFVFAQAQAAAAAAAARRSWPW